MVYSIGPDKPVCCFASFGRKSGWTIERTKGIDKGQLEGAARAFAHWRLTAYLSQMHFRALKMG
jgi:hypothetical protein